MKGGLTARTAVFIVMLLAIIVAGFVVMAVAVNNLESAGGEATHAATVVATANSLEKNTLDLETGLRGYLLTGQTSFLQPYASALRVYPVLSHRLEALTANDPSLHDEALRVVRAIDDYVKNWTLPVIALAHQNVAAGAKAEATGGGKARVDAIRSLFATFNAREQSIGATQINRADNLGSFAFDFALGSMALCALLVIGLAFGTRRVVVRPLKELADAASRVGDGELSVRVPEGGSGEIAILARGFNAMVSGLEADRDELENQNAELEAQQVEIETALHRIEEQKARSEVLRVFGDRLAASSGISEFCEAALREMADVARAEVGAMYLLDDNGDYSLCAGRGLTEEDTARRSTAQGLAGRAIRELRPVAVSLSDTELGSAGLDALHRARQEVHLPVLRGDRVLGVVSLGRLANEPFVPEDMSILTDLADRTGLAAAEQLTVRQRETVAHQLETLLESMDEGVYAIDTQGRVTLVNRSALDQTGYSRDELVGGVAHELMHHTRPDGRPYPRMECPIVQTFRERTSLRIQGEHFWRKDGTSFPVEFGSYPLFDEDRLIGAVVTFRDVSTQSVAERQRDTQHAVARVLAEANSVRRALSELLAVLCDGFEWTIGLAWQPRPEDGDLVALAWHAAPGYESTAEQLAATPVARGEGPAGVALVEGRPILISDRPGELARRERSLEAIASQLRSAVAVPILNPSGDLLGVAEFFGEQSLAEEGLAATLQAIAGQSAQFFERKRREYETEKMRQEFVANVSHELRTPLTAIDGWLEVLLEESAGSLNEEQQRHLGTVKRNSDRLIRLVGDLVLAGQIEAGRMTFEREDLEMSDLVQEAVELIRPTSAAKDLVVDVSMDGPAVVHGDRSRLIQLLNNLLSNAVKYTPEGGHISISMGSVNGRCRIAVSDDGIGIAEEDRDKLFTRFYRASSAVQHGIPGTGLGLTICQAIAEGHGGTVELGESEAEGTTFVVTLPLTAWTRGSDRANGSSNGSTEILDGRSVPKDAQP